MNVKICCIKSIEEADIAISNGATALGLVSDMPNGPGIISEQTIIQIRKHVADQADVFLLSSKHRLKDLVLQIESINPTHLQIVDYIPVEILTELTKRFKNLKIVQVIHVIDESIFEIIDKYELHVDYFLLDSGIPTGVTKTLGGTGRTHDWNLSEKIVKKTKRPVYLAGGLNASNVIAAIKKVKPFGVDLCSGVRTNDVLDLKKVEAFFEAI